MRKSTRSEIEQLINDVHSHCINVRDREIYLHGVYGAERDEDPGIEYQSCSTFIKNLHILNSQGEGAILLHMTIPTGGSWTEGMAMFNAIRFSKSPVVILAYGQVSSMSGVLLQAADKRVLMPDCYFMIHHGSIGFEEVNSIAAKSIIDINELSCKRMLEIFARRAKKGAYFKERNYNEQSIMRFIDGKIHNKSDWYLTDKEALYYGMCDGILGEKGFESINNIRDAIKIKVKL